MFWQNYVNFSGRSRRSEYWWPTLINSVIGLVIYIFMMFAINVPLEEIAKMNNDELAQVMMRSPGFLIGYIVLGFWGLATFLPCIPVGVRRLHDLNINGWWYATMLLNCLCGIAGIVFFFLFMMDSKPGTNEWGPSPKYPVTE